VIVCLVTDRRRFANPTRDLLDQIRRAVDAGIDLVQVRERDLEAAPLADLVGELVTTTRGSETRVVVNDRLDVAIATGSDGVHLRHDSVAVADARRLAPGPFLVGRSVHDLVETRAAAGADYLIAGTVFETTSKPGLVSLLGTEGLRRIVAASTAPVLGIGGITLDRLDAVAATGAAGIAAIGLFADRHLVDRVEEARRRFDSVRSPS
jgi:thiamine-phosphate pyrophosphorylase